MCVYVCVQELSRRVSSAADLDQVIDAHEHYLGTLIRKVWGTCGHESGVCMGGARSHEVGSW